MRNIFNIIKKLTLVVLMLLFASSATAQTVNPKSTYYICGMPGQTGWTLASGVKLTPRTATTVRYIAVTRDLEKQGFTLGKEVEILSYEYPFLNGRWKIMDRMSKRLHNRIDFLIHDKNHQKLFTRPRQVTMTLVRG